jgi:hypothetical protein
MKISRFSKKKIERTKEEDDNVIRFSNINETDEVDVVLDSLESKTSSFFVNQRGPSSLL